MPPDEVPLPGSGCVNGCVLGQTGKFAQSQNAACWGRYLETDDYRQVRTVTDDRAFVFALAGLRRNKNTPHHTCKASASCLPQANASCSNAALHTAEPCFIRSAFTLIELLVITAKHCRHFISNACIVPSQNTPLFLKEKSSCAKAMEENGNRKRKLRCRRSAFSREKKLSFPELETARQEPRPFYALGRVTVKVAPPPAVSEMVTFPP